MRRVEMKEGLKKGKIGSGLAVFLGRPLYIFRIAFCVVVRKGWMGLDYDGRKQNED
jgi:hypothetical protein